MRRAVMQVFDGGEEGDVANMIGNGGKLGIVDELGCETGTACCGNLEGDCGDR